MEDENLDYLSVFSLNQKKDNIVYEDMNFDENFRDKSLWFLAVYTILVCF